MNIGEKINCLRKSKGLSQEELADKLNVSRQSISLWENNQSLPTTDKLISLSRILEISMEELCTDEIELHKKNAEAEITSDESFARCNMILTEALYKTTQKIQYKDIFTVLIIFIVAFIYCLTVEIIFPDAENNAIVTISAIFLILLIAFAVRLIYVLRKNRKNVFASGNVIKYQYVFYPEHIEFNATSNNSETKKKMNYQAIKKLVETDNIVYFVVGYEGYIVDKKSVEGNFNMMISMLKHNAANYRSYNEKISKENSDLPTKKFKALKTVLSVLFISSFFSIVIGLVLSAGAHKIANNVSVAPLNFFVCLRMFFVAALIPLASLILGIYGKKHGLKCTKNIVVGVILAFNCLLIGAFSFVGSIKYSYNEAYIEKFEDICGVDFPDDVDVTTYIYKNAEFSGRLRKNAESWVMIRGDYEKTEAYLTEENMWSTDSYEEIFKSKYSSNAEKFYFYSPDYKENEAGIYSWIYIAYDEDEKFFYICEFDIIVEE